MSNKQEVKALIVSLLFCGGIVTLAILYLLPSQNPPDSNQESINTSRISLGQKILITAQTNSEKEAGVKAFAVNDFSAASRNFQASLKINPNDPETLIYLNNAKIGNNKALKIVVSVPIGSNLNVAQEILRGVAQAQTEVNNGGKIAGVPLQVEIANDDNDPIISKKLANIFIKDPEIMAVVGHNSSNVSVAVAPIYEEGKLVMISPTSSSQKLSSIGKYIFRTVFSIRSLSELLADYVVKGAHKKNIAICSDSLSIDNQSFIDEFNTTLYSNGAKTVDINCDLAASNFNPEQIVSQAIAKGSDSILLAPHIDRINQVIDISRANKKRLSLFGSLTLYTSQTLQSGQENINGLVLAVPWSPNQYLNQPFVKKAVQLWRGSVNWRTATSYDATLTIINGLKRSSSRQTLSEVLHNSNFSFNGATGFVQFLPSGDRLGKAVLVKVRPGSNSGTGYDFVPL